MAALYAVCKHCVISRGKETKNEGLRKPALSQGRCPGGGALFKDRPPFFSHLHLRVVVVGEEGGLSHLSIVGHVLEPGASFSPSLEFL